MHAVVFTQHRRLHHQIADALSSSGILDEVYEAWRRHRPCRWRGCVAMPDHMPSITRCTVIARWWTAQCGRMHGCIEGRIDERTDGGRIFAPHSRRPPEPRASRSATVRSASFKSLRSRPRSSA